MSAASATGRFFENAFLHSGVPMLYLSLSGLLVDCNHKFAELVGSSRRILHDFSATPDEEKEDKSARAAGMSLGVAQLLPAEDRGAFFQAVSQLLRKEVLSANAIRTVLWQDGSAAAVGVRSMMWLVKETPSASPQYVKCILTPLSDNLPTSFARQNNGEHALLSTQHTTLYRMVEVTC